MSNKTQAFIDSVLLQQDKYEDENEDLQWEFQTVEEAMDMVQRTFSIVHDPEYTLAKMGWVYVGEGRYRRKKSKDILDTYRDIERILGREYINQLVTNQYVYPTAGWTRVPYAAPVAVDTGRAARTGTVTTDQWGNWIETAETARVQRDNPVAAELTGTAAAGRPANQVEQTAGRGWNLFGIPIRVQQGPTTTGPTAVLGVPEAPNRER